MIDSLILNLIQEQRLPDTFAKVVNDVYKPICVELVQQFDHLETPAIIGINGCPGSGKSTMALFLKAILESQYDLCVEVLSIDDFYKTKAERLELAEKVHPLLATRGVPGTHDVSLALNTIKELKELGGNGGSAEIYIPRFDKARDDRHARDKQYEVVHAPDLIILEGWCVGATSQNTNELETPINVLEEAEDASGKWRNYVNRQLTEQYQTLFKQIDYLLVLQPPTTDIVLKWRIQQEQKLRDKIKLGRKNDGDTDEHQSHAMGMTNDQITTFVMNYERLIVHMVQSLPPLANILIKLDDQRQVTDLIVKNRP